MHSPPLSPCSCCCCCLCDIPRRNEIICKKPFVFVYELRWTTFAFATPPHPFSVTHTGNVFIVFSLSYIRSLTTDWTHADSGHTSNYFGIQNSFCSYVSFRFRAAFAFASWRAYVKNETETTKIFSISFTPFLLFASWPKRRQKKAAPSAAAEAEAEASTQTNRSQSTTSCCFCCCSHCFTHSMSTTMTSWCHRNPEWQRRFTVATPTINNTLKYNKNSWHQCRLFLLLLLLLVCCLGSLLAFTHLRHALVPCLAINEWEHSFFLFSFWVTFLPSVEGGKERLIE